MKPVDAWSALALAKVLAQGGDFGAQAGDVGEPGNFALDVLRLLTDEKVACNAQATVATGSLLVVSNDVVHPPMTTRDRRVGDSLVEEVR